MNIVSEAELDGMDAQLDESAVQSAETWAFLNAHLDDPRAQRLADNQRRLDQQAAKARALIATARRKLAARTRHRPPARAPRQRSRAPRQHRSTGSSTGGQDPGDPDPDSDPIQRRVQELVSQAPPFSSSQRQLLARLLGGGSR